MKRFMIIDLLWIVLILLVGWTWSLHDQSEYADRLNHYGLSEHALVGHPTKAITVGKAATQLAESDLRDLQVQFRVGAHERLLYATGDYGSLPLASGQWFSDADLRSKLPVVVVGSAVGNLHMGSHQQYLKTKQAMLPVLGVVTARGDSPLNRVIFHNASGSAAAGKRLASTTVYVDGKHLSDQKAALAKLLGVKWHTYAYDATGDRSWWEEIGLTALRSVGLALAACALSAVAARMIGDGLPQGLDLAMRRRYALSLLARALGRSAIAAAIGVAGAWWWFYFTLRTRMLAFAVAVWAVWAIALWLMTRRQLKKGAQS
ncbi:ABC transporter permease [Lacticaseibacillus kribbianus]|uniref:ABC transporter permease n=1 Tax=Lacticaseibacillus kribbianus TaxID=2926292 RepID=UPI001CD78911|nr:ABC transporter permease [Lacticaseibacillus kribbianus]